MRRPRSTYRLQVNADFKLSRVRELIDYFADLGISDLYLSPLLQARPGSTHGYDVIDPAQVNPEIGSAAELELLSADLRARNMGILLDIVPNHMAASEENPWWRDVLEHGPASQYAHYFDVDWTAELPEPGRIVLPILEQELTACIESGDLKLVLEDYEPAIGYRDRRLPVDPASYPLLIRSLLEANADVGPLVRAELERVGEDAARLPHRLHSGSESGRLAQALTVKQNFAAALRRAETSNGKLTVQLPADRLHELLRSQSYALTYWVRGSGQLNYRRFFDIADLAGLRTEDPSVFAAVHARSLPWLFDGTITGVRIDHIDGLREPTRYLQQLRDLVRERTSEIPYVVVEKILVGAEELPRRWAAAGTTGYEFAATVNALFVDPAGFPKLAAHFAELTGIHDFSDLVYDCKLEAMRLLFPAELESLTALLAEAAELPQESAERGLRELTACLPVYRTYFGSRDAGAAHQQYVARAFECAKKRGCPTELLEPLHRVIVAPENDEQREFTLRWQQFSGPVMAKGLEDTALYRYTALLSVCDVGLDPLNAYIHRDEFHERMKVRSACWPGTLNATSTHDSKRGEDVRARINVLSELADEWLATVDRWFELNARFRRTIDGTVPQPGEELLLYQTLLGAWPLVDVDDSFLARVQEFLRKALREAKERTSWREPNETYEDAVCSFARAVVSDTTMQNELRTLERRTSFYGALNSLSQLVLKLGAPGVPDFYQGNEAWALTLVDPDNRRPVDYDGLQLLRGNTEISLQDLRSWRDGRIKLHVTRTGLALRNEWPAVFASGEYKPVEVAGERAHNLIAFERCQGARRAVFMAARFYSQLCTPELWPAPGLWRETMISLGTAAWRNRLTGREVASSGETSVSEVLNQLPFAILTSE